MFGVCSVPPISQEKGWYSSRSMTSGQTTLILFFSVGFVSTMLSRTVRLARSIGHRQCRLVHVEKKLEELGIELPPAPTPKANYNIICHASGNILYISGHLPLQPDGTLLTGRIGPESDGKTIAHGYEAARHAGLNIISTLKEQLGDLDRVQQIVKVRWSRICVCVFVNNNQRS